MLLYQLTRSFHETYSPSYFCGWPRSLSDLKNRSEKEAERGQILTISPGNSRSIAQESGEIRGSPRLATGLGPWTTQPLLQPISFKSDRPLGPREEFKREAIKLVNVQGLYIAEASKKLDTGWPTAIASKSLRTWMKQEQSGEL